MSAKDRHLFSPQESYSPEGAGGFSVEPVLARSMNESELNKDTTRACMLPLSST
jgi:hypothetical protein